MRLYLDVEMGLRRGVLKIDLGGFVKYFRGESCWHGSHQQLFPQKLFTKPPQSIFRTPTLTTDFFRCSENTWFCDNESGQDGCVKGPLNRFLSSRALQNWSQIRKILFSIQLSLKTERRFFAKHFKRGFSWIVPDGSGPQLFKTWPFELEAISAFPENTSR